MILINTGRFNDFSISISVVIKKKIHIIIITNPIIYTKVNLGFSPEVSSCSFIFFLVGIIQAAANPSIRSMMVKI